MHEFEITFPITRAVIYPRTAAITRTGKAEFKAGENRMVISGLPEFLTGDSVRIGLTGKSNLSILEVFTEEKIKESYDENLFRQKKRELDELKYQKRKLEVSLKNHNDEFLLFYRKEDLGSSLEGNLHRPIEAENWRRFLKFLEDKLKMNREKAREILFQWLSLEKEIRAAEKNLEKYSSYEQVREHRVVTLFEAQGDITEEIRVIYLQPGVSWHPAYRLRAELETNRMAMTLFAMISQDTGEDWQDLSLELSTAIPMANCDIPTVQSRLIREKSAEMDVIEQEHFGMDAADEMDLEMDEEKYFAGDLKDKLFKKESRKIESKSRRRMKRKAGSMSRKKADIGGGPGGMPASTMGIAAPPQELLKQKPSKKPVMAKPAAPGRQAEMMSAILGQVDFLIGGEISLPGLPPLYHDLFYHICLEYSPESMIPRTGYSGTNPHFLNGTSPLNSMGGYDYRYKVGSGKNFIPALNVPIRQDVETRELPMELSFVTVPYKEETVFLKARFANNGTTPLPAGPAQVFAGNTFLGDMKLATLGRNKGTEISLGAERDIKVKRHENNSRKTTGLISKDILTDFNIEIVLDNFRSEESHVEVIERLPVSTMKKEILIQDIQFSEKPAKVTREKILIWQVVLKPGEKKTIKFSYTIKQPQDFKLQLKEGNIRYTG